MEFLVGVYLAKKVFTLEFTKTSRKIYKFLKQPFQKIETSRNEQCSQYYNQDN